MEILLAVKDIGTIKNNDYRSRLIERINQLITENFNGLIQILYRIDIDETRLRSLLAGNKAVEAAEIIADLVIERQLQKIKSRQHFRQQEENISDDEKW